MGILVLELFQALGLADTHAAIYGLPFVDGRVADAMLAAQIGDRNPGLVVFLNADDLIFDEPAALSLRSLSETGLAAGGNVNLDHGADDRAGGVELAPALSIAAGELSGKVFVDPAQQPARVVLALIHAMPEIRSINSPSITALWAGRQQSFCRTPLSDRLTISMAIIASSISLTMVGSLALACSCDQRAQGGTQKTFSARYFVGILGPFGVFRDYSLAFHLEPVGGVLEEDQA
jgi:hypothetical protein